MGLLLHNRSRPDVAGLRQQGHLQVAFHGSRTRNIASHIFEKDTVSLRIYSCLSPDRHRNFLEDTVFDGFGGLLMRRREPEWLTEITVRKIPKQAPQARRYFFSKVELIQSGWEARQRRSGTTESPNTWFLRNTYRLLKAFVEGRKAELLAEIARKSGRNLVGFEQIADNPFKVGLFAMWSDNSGLSRHQRRVFGTQMMYAYLHDVPPEDLRRFFRYAGSPQVLAKKLAKGDMERSFMRWRPETPSALDH